MTNLQHDDLDTSIYPLAQIIHGGTIQGVFIFNTGLFHMFMVERMHGFIRIHHIKQHDIARNRFEYQVIDRFGFVLICDQSGVFQINRIF